MILKHELIEIKVETQDSTLSVITRIYLFIYCLYAFGNANINEELMGMYICMYACVCLLSWAVQKKKKKRGSYFNL